jgi:hypothetical protein
MAVGKIQGQGDRGQTDVKQSLCELYHIPIQQPEEVKHCIQCDATRREYGWAMGGSASMSRCLAKLGA